MAIALFYTSLALLIGFFTIKYLEADSDEKHILSEIICMGDEYCHEGVKKTRNLFSKIKLKNFQRLFVRTLAWLRDESIYLKRRFDSKQPSFFLKQTNKIDINKKGSVSFFLKNVSEYKNSLKDKGL